MEKKASTKRILLLIIIFILIWFLLVCKFETEIEKIDNMNNISQNEIKAEDNIEIITESKIIINRNQNTIITQDYLNDLDIEGPLLIKKDGKYYLIEEGNFILDEMIISVNEDSKNIDFNQNPRIIITS